MENWKIINEECPKCGSEAEVYSSAKGEDSCYDGDEVRCVECENKGIVDCDEGYFRIDWDEY